LGPTGVHKCQTPATGVYKYRTPATGVFMCQTRAVGPYETIERQGAYEGTGKTTVNLLNKEAIGLNMIDSIAVDGFRLNNDTKILGPCVVFPNAVLSWRVGGPEDINEESLSLFKLLDPKLDVLVIGYGDPVDRNPVKLEVILKMRKLGMNLEILNTEAAVGVYNFLVDEGRVVAAALIPPGTVKIIDTDVVHTRERYQSIYGVEGQNYLATGRQERDLLLRPPAHEPYWEKPKKDE